VTNAPADDAVARRRSLLETSLTTRFGLRLHMSLMLAAAFSVGFACNFLMLRAGFHGLLLRWVLAYFIGYLVLFVAMRCWLAYVGVRPFSSGAGSNVVGDLVDGASGPWPVGGGGGDGPSTAGVLRGGGGQFGGGGASSGFDGRAGGARLTSRGGSSSHGGFSLGDAFDGDGLGKLLILIAVIVAVLAAFGGGIVFMVASAPHLLVDVAFGAALAGGVAPAARRVVSGATWEQSVLSATWKPVLAMFAVMVVAALVFQHFFPGMPTLGAAYTSLRAP
jgi:hypothetical protein